MIKKEKQILLETLKPLFDGCNLYIVDCEGLQANQIYILRYHLYQANIKCKHVSNAILQILFQNSIYTPLKDVLQKSSLLLFAKEDPKKPAQVIRDFRKKHKTDKPIFKGALAYEDLYVGEKSFEELMHIKSREELIGDIIRLLQSPAQQLVNVLESTQNNICGVIKTIEEK